MSVADDRNKKRIVETVLRKLRPDELYRREDLFPRSDKYSTAWSYGVLTKLCGILLFDAGGHLGKALAARSAFPPSPTNCSGTSCSSRTGSTR